MMVMVRNYIHQPPKSFKYQYCGPLVSYARVSVNQFHSQE